MITHSFDDKSPAKLNPDLTKDAPKVDACIITFSKKIEQYVVDTYAPECIGYSYSACGKTPVYKFDVGGKTFALFLSYIGAPACTAMVEDTHVVFKTDKYILFGGAGCLDRDIARGKVIVPTAAYRDEGTSYHYAPASDYIDMPGHVLVEAFLEEAGLPYAVGKTWTTDAIFRETENNFAARKADGCLSVEMESAGVQAMCTFRGLKLYCFFTSGDLLDAPKWTMRMEKNQVKHTQHDPGHFEIALALAEYVADHA